MRITETGQITIPSAMRNRFGINEDTEVDIIPTDDGLLIKKRKMHSTKTKGCL